MRERERERERIETGEEMAGRALGSGGRGLMEEDSAGRVEGAGGKNFSSGESWQLKPRPRGWSHLPLFAGLLDFVGDGKDAPGISDPQGFVFKTRMVVGFGVGWAGKKAPPPTTFTQTTHLTGRHYQATHPSSSGPAQAAVRSHINQNPKTHILLSFPLPFRRPESRPPTPPPPCRSTSGLR
nr:unnamed protein product [Digitaria exilis]